jgi:undecaprenyl-diphosphatase
MALLFSETWLISLQPLLKADQWLFSKINQEWINSFFDGVLPFLRQAEFWLPFYLFLLVFATLNFRTRGWWWALTLLMTGVISDLVSSHVIKELVFRYRPCRDPLLASQVRTLVVYCPESSSFVSSHACNHFAAAMFIFLTLKHTSPLWWLIFFWAFSISYAQVYVGVHFPLDVFCGALIGSCIGFGMNYFFMRQFGPLSLKQ